jgi:hypothetical protein
MTHKNKRKNDLIKKIEKTKKKTTTNSNEGGKIFIGHAYWVGKKR